MTHWDKNIRIGETGSMTACALCWKPGLSWIFFSWSQHLKTPVFKDTMQMTFAVPQLSQGQHPPSFLQLNWHCNHRKSSFQRWMGSSLTRRISWIHFTYSRTKLVSQLQFCEEWIPIALFLATQQSWILLNSRFFCLSFLWESQLGSQACWANVLPLS